MKWISSKTQLDTYSREMILPRMNVCNFDLVINPSYFKSGSFHQLGGREGYLQNLERKCFVRQRSSSIIVGHQSDQLWTFLDKVTRPWCRMAIIKFLRSYFGYRDQWRLLNVGETLSPRSISSHGQQGKKVRIHYARAVVLNRICQSRQKLTLGINCSSVSPLSKDLHENSIKIFSQN